MNTGKTRVIFYLDTDNDVFAFFPDQKYNEGPYLYTCYSRVGQHGPCHIDYVKRCKLAESFQYFDLESELTSLLGYDLNVINTAYITYHREPTPEEIRFGEGATHYKDLRFADVYKWNLYGFDLKKWTVCPFDGLRYYR